MLGVIIYLYFLVLGFVYSKFIFKDKSLSFHIWIGGILGNILLMMGIIIPAFIFGFTVLSHIILAILSIIPLLIIIKKKGLKEVKEILFTNQKDESMSKKIALLVILPFTLLICILMTNHILVSTDDGGFASGQSTYGDLNMHIGYVTSLAEQEVFPPEDVFISGHTLSYPFFINMLSSSLYLFGTSLRFAILLPSYVFSFLIVLGFYFLSFKLSKKKSVAVLALVFFLLCGGFGFAYFLDGARQDVSNFTNIFTEFYKTPTNYNENNIRWANSICDMIIPQRTTMAGWCMLMPCLWFLIDALNTKSKKSFIVLGVLAGSLPMIHTHSFLALGVFCIVLFFAYLFKEKTGKEKKEYIFKWIIFAIICGVLALPQLLFWTFRQTVGNSSFLTFQFNWVNHTDPYIWFYIKNFGITALFIIPAVLHANKDNKKVFAAALVLMLIAEFIKFQPNEYDNNKLIFVSYMIFVILVCDFLVSLWEKLGDFKGKVFLAILVIFFGTFSGILTIGREAYSGGEFVTFSGDMVKMAEYIKENTPKDAVFLTSDSHINTVATLAGRNIYLGSSIYVFFHGNVNEFQERYNKVKNIYNSSYNSILDFCKENGIDYIYLGIKECDSFDINSDAIERFEKVVTFGTESLYKVK